MDQGFCYKFDKQKVDSYREQKRSDELATRRCRQPVPKVNKKRIKPRKNRPFRHVREMRLECCNTTCLLNMGRDILLVIRSDFDRMSYQAQNEHLVARIETSSANRRNRENNPRTVIRYYSTGNENQKLQVCKQAFMKIYGVGKKRLRVLLKKRRPFSGAVEKDRRILQTNQKRLGPGLKAEVVEHIWSYEPQPSHYTRHKAPDKRYLDPKLNLSKIYKDFLNLKGYVRGTASKPPLSISSFRKIFFSYNLSFRKPRKDTCGRCDSLQVIIKHSTDIHEVSETKLLQENHWQGVEKHYDQNCFDFKLLVAIKNRDGLDWTMPPTWQR